MGAMSFSPTDFSTMRRSLVLIDGENLVGRYQKMKREGWVPAEKTGHIENLFVWNQNFIPSLTTIVRISYYVMVIDNGVEPDKARDEIGKFSYKRQFRLCAHIFKKPAREEKSRNVDIAICIDALRHTYQNHIDDLYLFSGDGDYLPLIGVSPNPISTTRESSFPQHSFSNWPARIPR
jgi:uncharacterized LabA/DUF88 family protein